MLFEAAGDIRGNTGVKRAVTTADYVEEPRHKIGKLTRDSGKFCTCFAYAHKCHFPTSR
jgi:hypothetical protein